MLRKQRISDYLKPIFVKEIRKKGLCQIEFGGIYDRKSNQKFPSGKSTEFPHFPVQAY